MIQSFFIGVCCRSFVTSRTTIHREEPTILPVSIECLQNRLIFHIFRNRAIRQNISYWIDLRGWCKAQLIFRDRWGRRGGCFFNHLPFLFIGTGATCFSILVHRWHYSIIGIFLQLCYLDSRLYVQVLLLNKGNIPLPPRITGMVNKHMPIKSFPSFCDKTSRANHSRIVALTMSLLNTSLSTHAGGFFYDVYMHLVMLN